MNGSSLIAGRGITGANQRLAMLSDIWSTCSVYPFLNGTPYNEVTSSSSSTAALEGGVSEMALMDFYGLYINDLVMDLQLDFARQVVIGDDSTRLQVYFNIYAEVAKAIVPGGGGGYTIKYA